MKSPIIKEGSRLLHSIFNGMNCSLIIIDEASVIQYANPKIEEMFGYKEGELEGKKLSILMPELHRKPHLQYVENSSANENNVIMGEGRELFGLRKDGSQFPFEIFLGDYEQDGKRYISGFVRDLTQAKENEKQFLDAIQNAELANTAKSDFLSIMSHEIRTPMNGVMGMISLLKQTNLSEDQNEYVELAYNSASMLVSILNDILDLAKIESGKIELEYIPFNIQVIIEDVLELFSMNANEKNVELAIIPSSNPVSNFIGDPKRLHQILANLAGNAIKFTEEGSVLIKYDIKELPEKSTHAMLEIEVIDTGIGVSENQQQEIFHPFKQADSSISREHGGTGLGLSIVKKLLLVMGSKIQLDSISGKGSTFKFNIELQIDLDMPENYSDSSLQGRKALVITPGHTLLSQSLTGFLSRYDFGITCMDRTVLFKNLSNDVMPEDIDILIVDLYFNNADTASLLEKLNSNNKLKTIPWIIVVPHGFNTEAIISNNHQFTRILHKPLRETTLFRELEDSFACWPSADQTDTEEQQDTDHKNIKILVVDDTETNLLVSKLMLQRIGHDADTAIDGIDALEHTKKNTYDLIFMDCRMPNMNGYEATSEIRALPGSNRNVPIIALTAQVGLENQERCTEAGMNDFLAKPLDYNAVEDMIRKWAPRP